VSKSKSKSVIKDKPQVAKPNKKPVISKKDANVEPKDSYGEIEAQFYKLLERNLDYGYSGLGKDDSSDRKQEAEPEKSPKHEGLFIGDLSQKKLTQELRKILNQKKSP
jgi:hypothetical protein